MPPVRLAKKRGIEDEVVAFFRSIAVEARACEGCKSADTLRSRDDADNVLLVAE